MQRLQKMLKFIPTATAAAGYSKDPSTKVGAIAIDDDHNIRAQGYNGLPRGVRDLESRLNDRPTKYAMTVHAEANLVATAARTGVKLRGCSVILTSLHPCSSCAGLLIQAGIKRIFAPDTVENARWDVSSEIALKMFEEAGVDVLTYSPDGQIVSFRGGGDLIVFGGGGVREFPDLKAVGQGQESNIICRRPISEDVFLALGEPTGEGQTLDFLNGFSKFWDFGRHRVMQKLTKEGITQGPKYVESDSELPSEIPYGEKYPTIGVSESEFISYGTPDKVRVVCEDDGTINRYTHFGRRTIVQQEDCDQMPIGGKFLLIK